MTNAITQEEYDKISTYIQLDEELLYTIIATEIDQGMSVYDMRGQVEAGKKWFQDNKSKLRTLICDNIDIVKRIDDTNSQDIISIIVVLVDALGGTFHGVSATLVATLVVKIGLRAFCSD